MSGTETRLHIVFGNSAREVLNDTLLSNGRQEGVIAFPDDLSIGPIDGEDAEARIAGLRYEFGSAVDHLCDLSGELEEFWRSLQTIEAIRVIWFTRRSAREYVGFLEVARRLGGKPYQIIDLSGSEIVKRHHEAGHRSQVFLSLGEMRVFEILPFLDSERYPSSIERGRQAEIWRALRQQNAPLRVLADGGIASESSSFFDDALLRVTPTTWQKIAVTIGGVWNLSWDDNVFQVDTGVLEARIRRLIEQGALKCRGNVEDIRAGEIRRMEAEAASVS